MCLPEDGIHEHVSEVYDCATKILHGEFADSIVCVQLKLKYEHLYSSFHVSVTVPVPIASMRHVIDCLMNVESCPDRLL